MALTLNDPGDDSADSRRSDFLLHHHRHSRREHRDRDPCASGRRTPGEPLSRQEFPPVSLVRPLCGIDNYAADTLRSTFALDYPHCEILFCVASAKDPVVPLVEALMAEHAGAGAQTARSATRE